MPAGMRQTLAATFLAALAALPPPLPANAHSRTDQSKAKATVGLASWYGTRFAGRLTADGETHDPNKRTAAHRSLEFGTLVRVTNLRNGRHSTVRINDRGPFAPGRVIDLSEQAARDLGMIDDGVAPVKIQVIAGR